ncbi:MAG TPA: PhnD/SsuA/transferrin family substrate-binding protein [bacterium]
MYVPRMLVLVALSLGVLAPAPLRAVESGTAPVHTLAIIPFYAPERMWQLYTPFVEYLGRATGEPWTLKLVTSHDEMIAAVCAGEVDVAFLGPVPAGRVNARCGAVPFVVALGKDLRPVYRAMLLTSDPAVTSTEGLRGRKVGFFRGSTAAHIVPLSMLRDAGLGPGSFEEVYAESQDKLMTTLLERKIAGAGVKENLYRKFEKEPVRLLEASAELPNFAFVALPSLSPAVRERLAGALLPLRPKERAADAETMRGWDDEIANGFAAPAPEFLPAVLRLRDMYEAVMHESR